MQSAGAAQAAELWRHCVLAQVLEVVIALLKPREWQERPSRHVRHCQAARF